MFQSVSGKIGNMRKSVEWTICPTSNGKPNERIIQSGGVRIARVNLETKKVMLSSGKGGHQGFANLSPTTGAKEYDCPTDILEQLEKLDGPVEGPVRIL